MDFRENSSSVNKTFWLILNDVFFFKTSVENCRPDIIEPACRAVHRSFEWDCSDYQYVNFTIAIMNSNVHSHVHKEGPYRDYSPCHTLFPNRFAIGVNDAEKDDLKRFASGDDYYRYVRNILVLVPN